MSLDKKLSALVMTTEQKTTRRKYTKTKPKTNKLTLVTKQTQKAQI